MSTIELLFILSYPLHSLFAVLMLGSLIIIAVSVFLFCCSLNAHNFEKEVGEKIRKKIKLVSFFVIPIFFFSVFMANIPTVDDLWKVRIGLLKWELASPDNVQKGVETIERLAEKLECKYLGCDKK